MPYILVITGTSLEDKIYLNSVSVKRVPVVKLGCRSINGAGVGC